VAFSRVIGLVYREVTPPFTVVIPDMVVFVLPIESDRQFCFIHMRLSFIKHIRPGTQKSHHLLHQSGGLKSHGDILFGAFLTPHIDQKHGFLVKAP
jgi:hypothetical protein